MANSCKPIKITVEMAKELNEARDWASFWATIGPVVRASADAPLEDLKGMAMHDLRGRLVPALNLAKVSAPANLRTGRPFRGWSYAVLAGAMYDSGYRSF